MSLAPLRVERQSGTSRSISWPEPVGYEALPIPRSERYLKLSYVRRMEGVEGAITWSLFRVDNDLRGMGQSSTFLRSVLGGTASGDRKDQADRGGYQRSRQAYERGARRGLMFSFVGAERSYFLVGEAPGMAYDDETRSWRAWAEEVVLREPTEDSRERNALARRYGGSRFSDIERRIAARMSLVEGWNAYDGENYIYLVHSLGSQAWKDYDGQLMGVRRYLTEQLLRHPREEPSAVGVVRICRDRQEYLDFGGVPEAAGYFTPRDDELVLFDPGTSDSLLAVMRHEAFHQYMYSALGGIGPHMWFDEGFGELMASAEIGSKRVVGFAPMTAHQATLAELSAEGGPGLVPMDRFLRLDRQTFYANPRAHYAQAWIWIEFLMHSDYGRQSSRGRDFCRTYVKLLREGWEQARHKAFTGGEPLSLESLERVREAALTSALGQLDWKATMGAFERFVAARVAFVPR
ncbi:MAG: hypothetical protein R3F17_13235 [Planctomycetota bacterium]